MKKYLYNEAEKLDIYLDETQLEQFIQFYNLLIQWNKFMNLTGITDYHEVVQKHFIDSLSFVKISNEFPNFFDKEYSIVDIGTGAGFPGIPLKIAFPNLEITLIDSLNKRINFLNEVILTLDLNNISAIHGRAEDFSKLSTYREKFDFAVSRAVSNLSTLSEYCLPFVKKDGFFISYKSEKLNSEIELANNAINILGGQVYSKIDFTLYDNYRNLLLIKKVSITPEKFPRKAGLALKKPL